jgi:hypothetical protein
VHGLADIVTLFLDGEVQGDQWIERDVQQSSRTSEVLEHRELVEDRQVGALEVVEAPPMGIGQDVTLELREVRLLGPCRPGPDHSSVERAVQRPVRIHKTTHRVPLGR